MRVCNTPRGCEERPPGPTPPTPSLGSHSAGSFPPSLMKPFFMSYSHPVLTTTIVPLLGPHVSHHQWDPNVADKITSLPWCCNDIPALPQILPCLALLGESRARATISPGFPPLSRWLVGILSCPPPNTVLRMPGPTSQGHSQLQPANSYEE